MSRIGLLKKDIKVRIHPHCLNYTHAHLFDLLTLNCSDLISHFSDELENALYFRSSSVHFQVLLPPRFKYITSYYHTLSKTKEAEKKKPYYLHLLELFRASQQLLIRLYFPSLMHYVAFKIHLHLLLVVSLTYLMIESLLQHDKNSFSYEVQYSIA